jgi:hypothetical protein
MQPYDPISFYAIGVGVLGQLAAATVWGVAFLRTGRLFFGVFALVSLAGAFFAAIDAFITYDPRILRSLLGAPGYYTFLHAFTLAQVVTVFVFVGAQLMLLRQLPKTFRSESGTKI